MHGIICFSVEVFRCVLCIDVCWVSATFCCHSRRHTVGRPILELFSDLATDAVGWIGVVTGVGLVCIPVDLVARDSGGQPFGLGPDVGAGGGWAQSSASGSALRQRQ